MEKREGTNDRLSNSYFDRVQLSEIFNRPSKRFVGEFHPERPYSLLCTILTALEAK